MFLIPVLLDSRQSLIDNSKIARDTRLCLQLFDSVDVSSSPLDLNSIYNEMRQIMGQQVPDFRHALTSTHIATPDGEVGTENGAETITLYPARFTVRFMRDSEFDSVCVCVCVCVEELGGGGGGGGRISDNLPRYHEIGVGVDLDDSNIIEPMGSSLQPPWITGPRFL